MAKVLVNGNNFFGIWGLKWHKTLSGKKLQAHRNLSACEKLHEVHDRFCHFLTLINLLGGSFEVGGCYGLGSGEMW